MATEIIMPKAGMAMERGTIIQWLKKPGDSVEVGDPILEIETDKVSMEVEAEVSGYLLEPLFGPGDEVDVITTIGYIGGKDETPPAGDTAPTFATTPAAAATTAAGTTPAAAATPAEGAAPAGPRPRATPAARHLAREAGLDLSGVQPGGTWGEIRRADVEQHRQGAAGAAPSGAAPSDSARRISSLARTVAEQQGIDPATVPGSGPGGRVLKQDVLAAAEKQSEPGGDPTPRSAPRRASAMRRKIAERMLQSHLTIPPVTLNKKIDVSALFALRKSLNEDLADTGESVSLTPLFVRATALALRESPWMRTSLDGEMLIEHGNVDIGIAVALEEGLLVPVLRGVDQLPLIEIHRRASELFERARERKLLPEELQGAVFSITNLGMYGISSFNPIINPPESAILGINAAEDQLYLDEGAVKTRNVMTLSLTLDHRVIDGAQGALFLQKLEQYLLHPIRLLL